MAGVFDLRGILERVDKGLDNHALTKQELVGQLEQAVGHIRLSLVINSVVEDQMQIEAKEPARGGLAAGCQVGADPVLMDQDNYLFL